MLPQKVTIKEKRYLDIIWQDNTTTVIKLSNLRRRCPCALCSAEKTEKGKKYIPIYHNDQLSVAELAVMGNYALNVKWLDGHNTGIYEFRYLKQIGESSEVKK